MYINKKDLEFLIYLKNKLGCIENWSDDVCKLCEMIERLQNKRQETNRKTLQTITEKRKVNANYGRSQKEIVRRERIRKAKEEVGLFN